MDLDDLLSAVRVRLGRSQDQRQRHLRGAPEPIPVSLRLAPTLNRRLKALRG